jgi:hypothetical protein
MPKGFRFVSWQATAKIAEITDGISRSEKLLLLVLANRHNIDTGRCDASVPRIAAEALMTERTAHRALDRLERKGMLVVERRAGRTNQYLLVCVGELSRRTPDISRGGLRRRTPDILSGVTPDILSATPDILSATPDISRGTNRKIEPNIEPKETATATRGRARETDADYGAACAAVEGLVGSLNKTMGDAVADELDGGTPAAWIVAACDDASLANVRKLNYVLAIVGRWRSEGFKAERKGIYDRYTGQRNGNGNAPAPRDGSLRAVSGADHGRPRGKGRHPFAPW